MSHPRSGRLTVRDPERLPEIVARIHDRLFNTEDIVLDEVTRTLTIPFAQELRDRGTVIVKSAFKETVKVPLVRSVLRIHNVERYVLQDAAHIGTQELAGVTYEPQAQRVTVTADVPVQVTVDVTSLEVSLEETGATFGVRTVSRWFGGLVESARSVIEPA
jgi:hypothetical protein